MPNVGLLLDSIALYTSSVLLQTFIQEYIALIRVCVSLGTVRLEMTTASDIASNKSCTVGDSANFIMDGGSTSGTPPTQVDTTKSPQEAASRRAMQKDSVKEQLRNM